MSENLIPDFDELTDMAADAARAKAEIILLKTGIARLEAFCIREALETRIYWVGGKRPTAQYCSNVIKILGNTKEEEENLWKLRIELAEKTETLQLLTEIIQIQKSKLDLYRTKSANERKGFL